MFTGPVGPVGVFFLMARSRFWKFLLLASRPGEHKFCSSPGVVQNLQVSLCCLFSGNGISVDLNVKIFFLTCYLVKTMVPLTNKMFKILP